MALADDVLLAVAAAVTTSTLVVLSVTLVRYKQAVIEATKSAQLAKNVWDSMNERLAVQDARIIDLIAKVEVYSVKRAPVLVPKPVPQEQGLQSSVQTAEIPMRITPLQLQTLTGSPETELQILTALALGRKSSREIKDVIGKSREHTARLMKLLYDGGLVIRDDRNKPYVYEITEAGKRYLSET